ncbi:MAG: flagellar biosynthetic protein FliO [Polyangiaceae bacterium]
MSGFSSSFRSLAIVLTLVATGVTTASLAFADDATPSSDSSSDTSADKPKPRRHHHTETPKAAETPAASATTSPADAPAASAVPVTPAASAQPAAPTPAPESKPLVLRETAAANAQAAHPMSLMADPAQGASWKIVGILGVMCAAAWAFKKKQEKKKPVDTVKSLQVLRKLSVGVRSELLVIDIDGQRLLIGVTPSTITTLASIPEVELEAAAAEAEKIEQMTTMGAGAGLGDRFAALVEGSRTTSGSVMTRNPTLPRETLTGSPRQLQMPTQSFRRRSSTSITQVRQGNDEALEGQARGLAHGFTKAGRRA